jgi:electron transfer flavoprotein beta subunit
MKIAICVKEVPDPAAPRRLDPDSGRLVRTADTTVNPYDRHAIEAAVQLREGPAAGAELTIVTMAPAGATRTVDKALAQGGDRSVHLADAALVGSDLMATSYALAELLRRDAYDLVLFGQSASDSECYVLPMAVAERLERPCVTQVASLELADGPPPGPATGRDRLRDARAAAAGPALGGGHAQRPALRDAARHHGRQAQAARAALGRRRRARSARIGQGGSRTAVRAVSAPPARGEGVRIEDAGDAAERILQFLIERRLVA